MWKQLLAIVMCLALIVPTGVMAEGEAVRYGVVTDNQVNVRKTAGPNGALWFKVDKGHVGQILDTQTVGGDIWYKVSTGHPVPNGRSYIGWIVETYFREMTAAELEAYLNSQEIPGTDEEEDDTGMQPSVDDALQGGDGHTEYTGIEVVGAKGKITTDANFRSDPSTKTGTIYGVIAKNTEVEITGVPKEGDANGWYRVVYQGQAGYVFCDLIEVLEGGAEPTPAPGFGTEVTGVTGEVTTTKVNFRRTAEKPTNNANVIVQLNPGQEFEILTVPDTVSDKTWYRVRYNGEVGYIQANFVRIISGETPMPELPDQGDGEVTVNATGMVTADKVNFRMGASAASSIYGKVHTGTVVQLLSIPTKIDENHWYKVFYNGHTGYIQAPYIRVLSVDEDALPSVETFGYAKLLEDRVNLRVSAGGDAIVEWVGKGSLLRITGEPVFASSYNWYPVYYASSHAIYYVREDMIQLMAVEGGTLVTPAPTESAYGYIVTTVSGVNLRTGVTDGVPGPSKAQVPKNTILACVGPALTPVESGTSYTWYKVRYNGITGYLRGDCVRVCTSTGGSVVAPDPEDPDQPEQEIVPTGYIRLIKDSVNLRKTRAGTPLTQLPLGLILPYYGDITPAGEFGQYCWYQVKTADGVSGYIRGDCAITCDESGTEVTPKPDGTEVTNLKGRLLKNTNFRKSAGFDGAFIELIPAGTIVDVLLVPNDTVNGWYRIKYGGSTGYVLASLLEQVKTEDGVTPTPTPSAFGYVMISDEKVAFRNQPGGNTIYTRLEKGTVWPMNGVKKELNGVYWYPINVNGKSGYVHGGFSFKLSPTQEESYLAGNGVPEENTGAEDVLTSYIITTYSGVNLRKSYSQESEKAYQVGKGTVIPYNDTKDQGSVTWYSIVYDHQPLWVHGSYVKVMTQKEYEDFLAANPDFETDPDNNLGYVKLTADNVYIRNAAAGSIIDQLRKGTVLRYYVDGIQGGGYQWYRVLTPAGVFGYIRADMVERCEENGDPLPVPTPNPDDTSSAPKLQQMTTYTNLYQGMADSEANQARVRNLVQELINQGYYMGDVTSTYTSQVKEAVKSFQTLNDLSVTGTADSATQHALFGTRPNGAGDTTNLDFVAYPVEKIDWFTGGIQEMLPRGAKFKIYDVKTGIVWWAYRQAGGKHMDIETLTAADSERLCQIYGVKNLQQIVDENKWQRRPSLVTIGTRTFVCSLDGMQHGDDTISNNGMDGQVCLHFTNSQGHASGEVSTSHAEAIEYAYKNAPNGQKK